MSEEFEKPKNDNSKINEDTEKINNNNNEESNLNKESNINNNNNEQSKIKESNFNLFDQNEKNKLINENNSKEKIEEKKEVEKKNIENEIKKKSFKCPYCYLDLASTEENPLIPELPIKCIKCQTIFHYINCFHCSNPIYFSEIIDFSNFSIQCPYKKCKKSFSITNCDLCKTKIYFSGRFPVKCPNKTCNNYFAKIKCPFLNCSNSITYATKITNPNPPYLEGTIVECNRHNPHFLFQKMTCFHCSKVLLFLYPQNLLIQGQKVICPYENCNESFNMLNCPNCNKNNFFPKGRNFFGINLKCIYCQFNFTNLFCPFCMVAFNIKNDKGKYIEGNVLKCPYNNPSHNNILFQIVNCVFCKQPNIFRDKKIYYHGQKVICAYKNCNKIFCKVPCPYCLKFNIFPKGDFSFGTIYSCIYENCLKKFSIFLCPQCKNYQVETREILEGQSIKCIKCNCLFFTIRCPHCKNGVQGLNEKLRFGQSILCPYVNCQKLFNYYYCCKCKRPLYDKNNSYSDGNIIKCAYKDCGISFRNFVCTKCETNNFIITNKNSDNDTDDGNENEFNDVIKCNTCQNKFYPLKIIKIFNEGKIMQFYQGDSIKFNQPIKDPYEVNAMKIFINKSELYSMIENINENQIADSQNNLNNILQMKQKEERTQCCFCLSKISESVFIPCGHRCICYSCGKEIMEKKKKCPICQVDATFLLPKVFDA